LLVINLGNAADEMLAPGSTFSPAAQVAGLFCVRPAAGLRRVAQKGSTAERAT
jgi:hypothetical protein